MSTPLRRVYVPSFWLQVVLEHVYAIETRLARSADDLRDLLVGEAPPDCVILGHWSLALPPKNATQLASLLRDLPVLVYGGWNTYGNGGYLQSAFQEVVPVVWEGFSQSFFRLAPVTGEPLPFPVEMLPPIASRHRLRPRPGGSILFQTAVGKEPAAILDSSRTATRLLLGFPLHPGGGQQLFFHELYPDFLASLLACVTGRPLPPRAPTVLGAQYLRAGKGELSREEIRAIPRSDQLGNFAERAEYAAVLAAEHRYYDIAGDMEEQLADISSVRHTKAFRLARARQFEGYAMMLHGDFTRAARAFSSEAALWLERYDASEPGPSVDVDFSYSWGAMAELCLALDYWSRHAGTLAATRMLARAAARLTRAGSRSGAHARIRSLAALPWLIAGHDYLRPLFRGVPPTAHEHGVRLIEWTARRLGDGSPSEVTGTLLLGLLLDDLAGSDHAVRLVRRGTDLDRALADGDIPASGWVVLTSLLGLCFRRLPPEPKERSARTVFLSYSREDANAVAACYGRLVELGIPAFMDADRLEVGAGLANEIEREARLSALFVPFVSKASVLRASSWISVEMEAALSSGIPAFVPVLLEDVRLPALLAMRVGIDARDKDGQKIAEQLARLAEVRGK